jgi:copper transporter 1
MSSAMDMPMTSAMSMLPTSTGMAMSGISMSPTTGMAGMTSSIGAAMTGMGGMSMGGGCKISMLWNWNVMDTCCT